MKSNNMVLTSVLALFLVSAGSALASQETQASPFAGLAAGGAHSAILQKLAGLKLSDDQKTAIAGILKDSREDMQATLKYYVAARENQFGVIHEATFNEQAVRDACRVTAQYEEELAVVRARTVSRIKQALTPEQQARLLETRGLVKERIVSRIELARTILDSWIEANSAE
ncbi:MAG: hypothetical protein A2X46_03505 [Lentisphaerae bacterium GWF2_57_35]|nr:MAG: hypothetical protein A2X46_03505 [Lentisphaerae bacterium GWF2_57_35]